MSFPFQEFGHKVMDTGRSMLQVTMNYIFKGVSKLVPLKRQSKMSQLVESVIENKNQKFWEYLSLHKV